VLHFKVIIFKVNYLGASPRGIR